MYVVLFIFYYRIWGKQEAFNVPRREADDMSPMGTYIPLGWRSRPKTNSRSAKRFPYFVPIYTLNIFRSTPPSILSQISSPRFVFSCEEAAQCLNCSKDGSAGKKPKIKMLDDFPGMLREPGGKTAHRTKRIKNETSFIQLWSNAAFKTPRLQSEQLGL